MPWSRDSLETPNIFVNIAGSPTPMHGLPGATCHVKIANIHKLSAPTLGDNTLQMGFKIANILSQQYYSTIILPDITLVI